MVNRTVGGTRKAQAPKLPAFNDMRDDLDAYLNRFERFATAQKWPDEEWATDLSVLLTGRALETFYRLPAEQAEDYALVKAALLQRYQLTEEGFRTKFYEGKPKTGETGVEYMNRIDHYLTRWMTLGKIQNTYEDLRDLIVREQFLHNCDKDVNIYLREKKLGSSKRVAEFADRYLQIHGCNLNNSHKRATPFTPTPTPSTSTRPVMAQACTKQNPSSSFDERRCFTCNKVGHISARCPQLHKQQQQQLPYCTKCHKHGHFSRNCRSTPPVPSSAVFSRPNQTSHQLAAISFTPHRETEQTCTSTQQAASLSTPSGVITQASSLCGRCNNTHCHPVSDVDQYASQQTHVKEPVYSGACIPIPLIGKPVLPALPGRIGKQHVTALRDTGCTGVIVKSSLVHNNQLTGETRQCIYIDGTSQELPVAHIHVQTPYYTGTVEALCMDTPIYDLVIGNIPGATSATSINPIWDRDKYEETTHSPTRSQTHIQSPFLR